MLLRRAAQHLRQSLASHSKKTDISTSSITRRSAAGEASSTKPTLPSPPPPPSHQPPSHHQQQQPQKQGLDAVPTIIKALGFGGVIPFWAFSPTIAAHLPLDFISPEVAATPGVVQVAYGATILSFLGGVHWGLAMTSLTPLKLTGQRYMWSVLPCLCAWPTVGIMPVGQAAGCQAGLLGLVYLVDRGWFRRGGLPPWYMSLRLPLTVLAGAGLAMTAVSSGV